VVVAEVRRGYTFNGRVIRPALVQVAAEDLSEGN
jgi:molecular chaperone GrpE (heat shock protein)